MSDRPGARDFPTSWADDDGVTRRQFARTLARVSCASFAATAALSGLARAQRPAGAWPQQPIGRIGDLPIGGSRVFLYPSAEDRCLLVRLDADRFVAFDQSCTHLRCPVVYEPAERVLHCPCHEGFFHAEDGRVLSGPPPQPLPRIALEQRGDELWAVGVLS